MKQMEKKISLGYSACVKAGINQAAERCVPLDIFYTSAPGV